MCRLQSAAQSIMEIDLEVMLQELELSMDKFIDLCIMCGCDYANNIRGIGAVRALSLIKQHGSVEAVVKVRMGGWPVPRLNPCKAAPVTACSFPPAPVTSRRVAQFTQVESA